ncbi:MAG: hypothetical protein ABI401_16615 [Candidatus Dormibacter sp.]
MLARLLSQITRRHQYATLFTEAGLAIVGLAMLAIGRWTESRQLETAGIFFGVAAALIGAAAMYFLIRPRLNKLGLLGTATFLYVAIYFPAWAFWHAPKWFMVLALPPLALVGFYARNLESFGPKEEHSQEPTQPSGH